MSKTAVLITGPRWWGDPSVDRGRQPVSITEMAVVEARDLEVADERRAIETQIGALPEGTLVIHGAARGADTLASQDAQRRGLPIASVPYFGHLGRRGGSERNEAMIAMLQGLAAAGWKVKVVAFLPERGGYKTADREGEVQAAGTLGCLKLAEEAGVFVKVAHPEPPPQPEEETPSEEEKQVDEEPAF